MKSIIFAGLVLLSTFARAAWLTDAQVNSQQRCFRDSCVGHNRDFQELLQYCQKQGWGDPNAWQGLTGVMYSHDASGKTCYCRCDLPYNPESD